MRRVALGVRDLPGQTQVRGLHAGRTQQQQAMRDGMRRRIRFIHCIMQPGIDGLVRGLECHNLVADTEGVLQQRQVMAEHECPVEALAFQQAAQPRRSLADGRQAVDEGQVPQHVLAFRVRHDFEPAARRGLL